jgi:hypothetical protein
MRARRPRSNAKDAHRSGDVLDLLLSRIVEGEVELVADMVVHRPRHADPAGLGQGFEAGGDVDAVAVDVVVVADNVANIYADAKFDALIRRHLDIAFDHSALDIDGAANGVDDADEFHQHAVSGRLNDMAAVLGDLGIDQFLAMRL